MNIINGTLDYYNKNAKIHHQHHIRRLWNRAESLPGQTAPTRNLDYGCGSGRDTNISERGYKKSQP